MIPTSNPFKEAIKAGKPQIGFWLMLASPMPPDLRELRVRLGAD